MLNFAETIRCVTVAPIMACAMLALLLITKMQTYDKISNIVFAFLFLTILPILAYPLQKYIPGYKDKGREGQRDLAMLFAVCGYVFGCVVNLLLNLSREMWIIYLTYLISGTGIFLLNKLVHYKASGHACGVAGPIALLLNFGIPVLIPGIILLGLVGWASLTMKRHTVSQLAGGAIIPLAVVVILNFLIL